MSEHDRGAADAPTDPSHAPAGRSDDAPTPRGPHRWRPGESGNPRGRPRGQSISAELRRQASPEQVAAWIIEIASGQTSDGKPVANRERLQALALLADRVEGRAVSRSIVARLGASHVLPVGFDQLGPGEKSRVLDELRARALRGDALALDDAAAIDVGTPPDDDGDPQ